MSSSDGRFITPSNHGALVGMVVAIGMVWTILVFSIRIFIRLSIVPPFGQDDATASLGLIVAVGQATATLVSVHYGLGQRESHLINSQLDGFLQSSYAAAILYIIAIAASKCSTSLLIARLTRTKHHLIASHSITAFIALWALASVLVIAIPPWDSEKRLKSYQPDRYTRWAVIEGFSMAIEGIIFALSIYLVWSLYMPLKTKAVVVGAFFCRILIIPPTVVRLRFLNSVLHNTDLTYDSVNPAILTQVVMHFSLMACTIPCMKQFLRAFDTDLGHTININQKSVHSFTGSGKSRSQSHGGSYLLHSIDKSGEASTPTRSADHQLSRGAEEIRLRPEKVLSRANVSRANEDEVQEEHSFYSEGSERAIIRKTQRWDVTFHAEQREE